MDLKSSMGVLMLKNTKFYLKICLVEIPSCIPHTSKIVSMANKPENYEYQKRELALSNQYASALLAVCQNHLEHKNFMCECASKTNQENKKALQSIH